MVLLDGGMDKPKIRSNTYAINPFGDKAEEKIRVRKGAREHRDGGGSQSLIKDINNIK
jgi:hypothetical protein